MAVIQTIIVQVSCTKGIFTSPSRILSHTMSAEEYVDDYLHELGLDDPSRAAEIKEWRIFVAYHVATQDEIEERAADFKP